MIKDNFIIITGGPGSGKSSILESLSKLGYTVIGETARLIIRERLQRGLSPRPSPEEFAQQIFDIDFKNYTDNIHTVQPVFFDRSFLDSAAMIVEANKAQTTSVTEILDTYRFGKNVFIAPPWKEIYKNDSERDQSYSDAVDVYEKLHKWYALNDYTLIEIPKLNIDGRIRFILSTLEGCF
jgi:predicted ATPase